MSEENKVTKVSTPAPALSTDQLLALLVETQRENAKNQKLLAEALVDSRKPWVDPAVLEQKRLAGEEKRKQVAITILQRTETKRQCLHRRTNNDGTFGEKLNIKWQEHSGGIVLGVCGTCFSQFDSRNPDDLKWLRQDGVAIKNMGRARENSRTV
jgi:hypothetical protein